MRFIYVDEAGTSAKEPVTVVVGLIVHADKHWLAASQMVTELLLTVPKALRDDFVSHATDVWNGRNYGDAWSAEDRRKFLLNMMALPRRLGIPIAIAMVRRDAEGVDPGPMPLRKEQFQHVVAFGCCIEQADDYLRRFGEANEVATVIAEDVPEIKAWIRKAVSGARAQGGWTLKPEHQRPTKAQIQAGELPKERLLAITRVIDVVHFIGKREGPLLQATDACAFGFRRYFAEQEFGEECVRAMLGCDLVRDDWAGGMSQFTFYRKDTPPQ
jgi:hypothetical protein